MSNLKPNPPAPRDIQATDPAAFFPHRFRGKTILMTGAARGIGKATAMRAAREGANVVIADILTREGQETLALIRAEGGSAIFVHTDVRKDEDCQRMVEETVKTYGRLDLVLNAAGVMDGVPPEAEVDVRNQRSLLFAPIHEATDEYWDQCFAVNTTGMFYSLRHEIRQLLRQNDGGAIVNIGSIAGLIGLGGTPAYNASKHAVTGLTRNAAIDYAPYGIRVNSVNMAATATPMTDAAYKKVFGMREADAAVAQPGAPTVPDSSFAKTLSLLGFCDSQQRMATPAEQAAIILFLLSDDAANMTGACVATDGGWTAY